ncbi:MAG: hypothetical protein KF767_16470 [Bdellovibrionaceae bacterium]|nr:hypothetical protein [Pseudobdellovibrionaceae bacterium]
MRHSILRPFLLATPLLVLGFFAGAESYRQPTKPAPAQSPSPATKSPDKPKSQYNTNVFEKDDENIRFSDTVKLVRELDGNTEVLFMQRGGIYQAPSDQTALARLIESQRGKTSVNVIVNEASQKIMSVLPGRAQGTGQ